MTTKDDKTSSESSLESHEEKEDKSDRIAYHNLKDNVPIQTEAEEANVHEKSPVEHLSGNVGIIKESKESIKDHWKDLLNESVHTRDDIDIGDIEAINKNFLIVKRGFVNIHRYYIPLHQVEGWGDNVLWLKVTEQDVKSNYQRNIKPDPTRYQIKDINYQDNNIINPSDYPPLSNIPNKSKKELQKSIQKSSIYNNKNIENVQEKDIKYKCDLCEKLFESQTKLSEHIEKH